MKRKLESENSGKVMEFVKDCFEFKNDKKLGELNKTVECYSERKKVKAVKSYFEEKKKDEKKKALEELTKIRNEYFEEKKKKKKNEELVGYANHDTIMKANEEMWNEVWKRYSVQRNKRRGKEYFEEMMKEKKKELGEEMEGCFESIAEHCEERYPVCEEKKAKKRKLEEMEEEENKIVNEYREEKKKEKLEGEIPESAAYDTFWKALEMFEGFFEEKKELETKKKEKLEEDKNKKTTVRKLEEMESANHENFGEVMEILKGYCEDKTKKKKEEVEDKNNKKKLLTLRRRGGGMQLVRDSNGKLIPTGKTYAEGAKERLLWEEEQRKKRIADGIPEPPRHPRWSDEIMATHIWTGMCIRNGMEPQKYQLREDYHNMNRHEIRLDLKFRKVYKAKEEEEAAAAAAATTA